MFRLSLTLTIDVTVFIPDLICSDQPESWPIWIVQPSMWFKSPFMFSFSIVWRICQRVPFSQQELRLTCSSCASLSEDPMIRSASWFLGPTLHKLVRWLFQTLGLYSTAQRPHSSRLWPLQKNQEVKHRFKVSEKWVKSLNLPVSQWIPAKPSGQTQNKCSPVIKDGNDEPPFRQSPPTKSNGKTSCSEIYGTETSAVKPTETSRGEQVRKSAPDVGFPQALRYVKQ